MTLNFSIDEQKTLMEEDLCSPHLTATWFLSIVISSGKLRHGSRTSVAKGSFQFPHGLFLD